MVQMSSGFPLWDAVGMDAILRKLMVKCLKADDGRVMVPVLGWVAQGFSARV